MRRIFPSVGRLQVARPRLLRLAAALLLLAPWVATEARAASYDLGLRVAYAAAVESEARFDRVFDDQWPELGLELVVRGERWAFEVTASRGETSGRDTLTNGGQPVEGPAHLKYDRVDATLVRSFRPGNRWGPVVGLGPTAFTAREDNVLLESDATAVGAHLMLGLERRAEPWTWRFGLRYAFVPDAVQAWDGFVPVGAEDLGIVTLSASPRRTLAPAPPSGPSWSRWSLRAQAVGLFPTHTSRQVLSAATNLESEADPTAGVGLGGAVRIGGPLRLSADVEYFRPTLDGREVFTNASTTFTTSGAFDLWIGVLGLDVRIAEHGPFRLFVTPLVTYADYKGETTGEFEAVLDRQGWNAGLGLDAEIGRGRWATRIAVRHLALARIQGFESGFDLEPITLDVGVVYRVGEGGHR